MKIKWKMLYRILITTANLQIVTLNLSLVTCNKKYTKQQRKYVTKLSLPLRRDRINRGSKIQGRSRRISNNVSSAALKIKKFVDGLPKLLRVMCTRKCQQHYELITSTHLSENIE